LPVAPSVLTARLTGICTADYASDDRTPARVSRNGSDCGSGCRTLCPLVSILLLLGLRLLLGWLLSLDFGLLLALRRPSWRSRICRLRLR
jgi:hypothetical protein